MRFYYNGNLIRTSRTHHYTHALLNSRGGAVMCSAKRSACESFKQSAINHCLQGIENGKSAIKALEAKRGGYWRKEGRKTEWYSFSELEEWGMRPKAKYEEIIAEMEHKLQLFQSWQIVEIEERD